MIYHALRKNRHMPKCAKTGNISKYHIYEYGEPQG